MGLLLSFFAIYGRFLSLSHTASLTQKIFYRIFFNSYYEGEILSNIN